MNQECEIVKDLLFGYVDGTISKSSEELVEKHIANCKKCKQMLEDISKEKEQKQEEKEVDYLKKVNKKMKKKTIAVIVSLAIIIIAIILLHIYIFSIYNKATCLISANLEDTITREEINEIKANLKNEYGDDISIVYYSKEQELGKMKQWLQTSGDSKIAETLDCDDEGNSPFLQSLQISANSKEQAEKIAEELQQLEGIRNIVSSANLNPYEVFIKFLYGDYGKI